MSTDAARTKLRELIATKQQWLRQWQAPELLSPGRSDMIQVLSDNIAELQQVLAELDKAEPQEPDNPERRCGGPGCDLKCCQPVQEPQGCAHCNHPLYAAVKCRVCGRVTEPVQEPVAWSHINGTSDTKWHPPQRKPLTEEEIMQCFDEAVADYVDVSDAEMVDFARAIERAHGIGGKE